MGAARRRRSNCSNNQIEDRAGSTRDSSKIINDVRWLDTGSDEKVQEKKLEVRMPRWICGVAKLDRIRNERIRKTARVGETPKKLQESRLDIRTGSNYVIVIDYEKFM